MSKPLECTKPRENPKVNHGLGAQNVDSEGGRAYVATWGIILCTFCSVLFLIETVLKNSLREYSYTYIK